MKCLYCQQEMYSEKPGTDKLWLVSKCFSIECMVNKDFPRYICRTDANGKFVFQEYASGPFYVKVSEEGSEIYRLISCMLTESVKVPESLWLNPTNFEATLDKVKGLHYVLWNG